MSEFWNDQVTDISWKALLDLKKRMRFVLIGGWANYLYTHAIKSKDIDIILELDELYKLKKEFPVQKNEWLKKYEIKLNEIDIDIYVPFYSEFALPIKELLKDTESIEGISVIGKEKLLILKQKAEMDRMNSIKGQKDRVDILNLMIRSEIKWEKYNELIEQHKLDSLKKRLKQIIQTAKNEFEYLEINNPKEIKKIKQKIMQALR